MAKWFVAVALFLAGCSSDPVPVVTKHTFSIKADATLNTYQGNQANPVIVRLYQLTDKQMFSQLAFIDLYNQDIQLLAANLVSKQILPAVLPNSNQTIEIDVNKNTQYLAVLVEFADYQNSEAKSVTMLPTDEDQYVELYLSGIKAQLNIITPDSSWWQVF
ncbi:type VI secretion system lipoprotein TssJ [Vibrio sp. SCSIO 43135]|uniref:Type VI secretion system lipoprotein TssJ n=1 Tax=Vibrio paucivorans TaxID=2829489 RepID=A0A9X3HQ14_9VIBR|nr:MULTISPECIES: type VI secretion system lipoprotein TssJ [Vibrio]MCW8332979.1 type VI secretion system lipoprotein TssJ [Vibrio paucivorans]USD39935.1 type VI secretion system lipoprotein TssJ [Vibrio sp. SCSIO 43135]